MGFIIHYHSVNIYPPSSSIRRGRLAEGLVVGPALADGRGLVRGVACLAPFGADQDAWLPKVRKPAIAPAAPGGSPDPLKPDGMDWKDRPVRQPFPLFGARAGA